MIHNAVVTYLASKYGLTPNYYANEKNHYDLYSILTREVWEVKPISYIHPNTKRYDSLQDQLNRYLSDNNIKGHPLGNDIMHVDPYTVNIYSNVPGEVYYSFNRKEPQDEPVPVPVPEPSIVHITKEDWATAGLVTAGVVITILAFLEPTPAGEVGAGAYWSWVLSH